MPLFYTIIFNLHKLYFYYIKFLDSVFRESFFLIVGTASGVPYF